MSYVRIDVDLDEVYNEMGRSDKHNMAEWLYEDGILDKHPNAEIRKMVRGGEESNGEKELRDDLSKIWNSYYRLTNEEQEIIQNIANIL